MTSAQPNPKRYTRALDDGELIESTYGEFVEHADYAKLEQQRNELQAQVDKFNSAKRPSYAGLLKQRNELLSELKTTLAALEKYGKHLDGCDSFPRHEYDQRLFTEMKCDCGLAETIAKAGVV